MCSKSYGLRKVFFVDKITWLFVVYASNYQQFCKNFRHTPVLSRPLDACLSCVCISSVICVYVISGNLSHFVRLFHSSRIIWFLIDFSRLGTCLLRLLIAYHWVPILYGIHVLFRRNRLHRRLSRKFHR